MSRSRFFPIVSRIRKTGYSTDWNTLRSQVLLRDDYFCRECGSTEGLQVHHIIPLSKGGKNNLLNLKTLCQQCHSGILGDAHRSLRRSWR